MIKMLLDILTMDAFYGVSEDIEIAKGKNKLKLSFGEKWEEHKRKREWSRKY